MSDLNGRRAAVKDPLVDASGASPAARNSAPAAAGARGAASRASAASGHAAAASRRAAASHVACPIVAPAGDALPDDARSHASAARQDSPQNKLPRMGIAFAIAAAIFLVDALTTLDIAIAVLYVVVVLIVAPICSRRSMLAVCCALMALTVIAFVMSHSDIDMVPPIGRCIVSLAAIGISGFLTLKNIAATDVLREHVALLDLTSDALIVYDMKRRIRFWNSGAHALYGVSAEQALGRSPHEVLQTAFPLPLADMLAELRRTGRWEGELTQTCRDGRELIVASRWTLQRDLQDKPLAVLVTNNDITQRRRMEIEIQRQQQEIRAAIDAIPAMVWVSSTDGRPVFVNQRWSELGLPLEQIGENWHTLVHPDDLPQMKSDWSHALATGAPFENESRMRGGDGAYRWVLLRATPLTDDDGHIVRWYGVTVDIEERKRAAEALARSESFLAEAETLSETGSIGFSVPRFEMFWSKQAFRIFGYPDTVEPSLRAMLARVHPDDHARVSALMKAAGASSADTDRDIEAEFRLTMPGGAVKQVHLVAHAVDAGHEASEFRGALMDVTEARNVQDALHRSLAELAHVTRVTMLGELSASIAHEVSQPIAAIMTNGDAGMRWLDRDEPQLNEVRAALSNMLRDAQRAGGIVQRIRTLAKKSAPNRAPFDLNALIDESALLIQREIGIHAIELDLQLTDDGLTIIGDRVQLQQVVINLMMNAIQAMAAIAGQPRRLTVRSSFSQDDGARVDVVDSGPGIAEADLQRLFQPFFTTRVEGMGMGLSICRSIVESHGGKIRACSEPGCGATISFVLPNSTREEKREPVAVGHT
ncbi:PAS domain-containing sensor histidine kinase [Paraburkholderia rhizosphaerae]|uniref:histidine kinase n=1 Tax=Paraburkholderia rhizosphaerae TaxID=480658 RepID=A0A4R8LI59_9BURK|nr:PAS domain-containing sensor histidine kinase [Paraburkholderia rhizosphaerae]TDY42490.1 PAS domain S-box-containing protein [Paraburkholderia rhizosphaerae]